MKKTIRILLFAFLLLLCTVALADVDITTTFPDKTFQSYIKENFDKDGDGILSGTEIKQASVIDCSNKLIENLQGIECFIYLEELYCEDNLLTTIDVSKNTVLETLDCSGNKISELDLSKNKALEWLDCSKNKISSIDLSKNISLETVYCNENKLIVLDVSQNVRLELLYCQENKLNSLNLGSIKMLNNLSCNDNPLTQLDISQNIGLTSVSCSWNKLTQIDVSKNFALEWLSCDQNKLTEIDVSNNKALEGLDCSGNKLTELNLNNPSLSFLSCYSNDIKQLDVSNCSQLSKSVKKYERDRTGTFDNFGEYDVCIDSFTTVIADDFVSEGIAEKSDIPASITIEKTKLTIKNSKSKTVKATLANPDDTIAEVKSSNNKIVKVKNSDKDIIITPAKKAGKATVTIITEMGAEAKLTVTVKEFYELNEKSITLKKSDTFKIKVTSVPSSIKAESFESSKPKVAKVDKKGKITAKKKGKATITVTLSNGEKLKLKVTVK